MSPLLNCLIIGGLTVQIGAEEFNFTIDSALLQNYPNPFNLHTIIKYQLPINTCITLRIYDLLGREIRTLVNENQYAGDYSVIWDGEDDHGNDVCTSIYYYILKLDNGFTQSEILLLIR